MDISLWSLWKNDGQAREDVRPPPKKNKNFFFSEMCGEEKKYKILEGGGFKYVYSEPI